MFITNIISRFALEQNKEKLLRTAGSLCNDILKHYKLVVKKIRK